MLEKNRIEKNEKGTDYRENNQNTHVKSKLKFIIPIVAIILVIAIAIGSARPSLNSEEEKIPNLAIYLQGTQLKCSYLDEINPIFIHDDYPYKKVNYGLVNYGKYYNTAGFIAGRISFVDSDTLVYPIPEDENYDYTPREKINLKDGTIDSYSVEYSYKTESISEEFYSADGKYVYYIDSDATETKNLIGYNIKRDENLFTIRNVEEILGMKEETGEIFYLKKQGTGKMDLYKTVDGKEESKLDYGITGIHEFYSTGESYYSKGEELYYFNGKSAKKIADINSDYYYKSRDFASETAACAIADGKSLNIIVKDKVKNIKCETEPHDIVCSSDGSIVCYLDNVREKGFYVGKVKYNSTNSLTVGDLYKISINDSNISEPELYDTDVSKETVNIEEDGAVSYYKNYMLLFSIVDLDYPTSLDIGDFYVNKKLIGEKVNFVEYVSQNEIYYICDVDNLKNVDNLVVKNEEDVEKTNLIYPTLIEIESPKNFTSGTLKMYNGTQSVVIADDVHDYYIKDNGQVLMLMNCDEDTYFGELYLYSESGNVFIDYDVTDIIHAG